MFFEMARDFLTMVAKTRSERGLKARSKRKGQVSARSLRAAALRAIKEGRVRPFRGLGDSYGLKPSKR